MRLYWTVICLTLPLLASPLHAAESAKAAVAEDKAEKLEKGGGRCPAAQKQKPSALPRCRQ